MSRVEPYGHWGWVFPIGAHIDLADPSPGPRGGAFALPPEFVDRLPSVLARVNREFGTLLDFYEEEDVSSPEILRCLANAVQDAFSGHHLEGLARELIGFVEAAASLGQPLTFSL